MFRIALCQVDIDWLRPDLNSERVVQWIERASEGGADIAVFPEMVLSGFSMSPAEACIAPNSAPLQKILDASKSCELLITFGCAVISNREYRNECWWVRRGEVLARYAKNRLFSFAGEHKQYQSGTESVELKFRGHVFASRICYDLRFPDLFASQADAVTGAYVVVANWPAARALHWTTLLRARALDNQAYVIGVNRVGAGGGLEYSGDSVMFGPRGEILTEPSQREEMLWATIDPTVSAKYRREFPLLVDRQLTAGRGARPGTPGL